MQQHRSAHALTVLCLIMSCLQFYNEVSEYRRLFEPQVTPSRDVVLSKARHIVQRYVAAGAPKEVNLSSSERSTVEDVLKNKRYAKYPTMFDKPQAEVGDVCQHPIGCADHVLSCEAAVVDVHSVTG